MEPVSPVIPGTELPETIFAANQPEYRNLPAIRCDDKGVFLSRWHLSEDERREVLESGDIYAFLYTFNQPLQPIALQVERPGQVEGAEVVKEKQESNLVTYARRELQLAGLFDKDADYDGEVAKDVLKLIEIFAGQGHAEGSALQTIALFSKLAQFKPLTPLGNPKQTGDYHDVSDLSGDKEGTILQSTRDPSVFSKDGGATWYDLDDDKREIGVAAEQ